MSTIYDYLDALETESAMQLDLPRQPVGRGSRRHNNSALTGTPPSYERERKGDAWDDSGDGRSATLASPAESYSSDQSGASNAYYVEIKAKLATMNIELNVAPFFLGIACCRVVIGDN